MKRIISLLLTVLFIGFVFNTYTFANQPCCPSKEAVPLPPGALNFLPGTSSSSTSLRNYSPQTSGKSTSSLLQPAQRKSTTSSQRSGQKAKTSKLNNLPPPSGAKSIQGKLNKSAGIAEDDISGGYKSIYDIIVSFLEAVFLMFLSVILLKPYSIVQGASSDLRDEFNREDAQVVVIKDGKQAAISEEIRNLRNKLQSLRKIRDASTRIFKNIDSTIDEISHILHRIAEHRSRTKGSGWRPFESLFNSNRREFDRRLDELKAQLEGFLNSLSDLNKGGLLTVITKNELEGLKSAVRHIGAESGSLSRITSSIDNLRSVISSRLESEIERVSAEKEKLEGAYYRANPRVEFDLLTASRAAEKRNLLNGVETVLTYCYFPFIRRFLEGKILRMFVSLFFLFNLVSLMPFISGFIAGHGLSHTARIFVIFGVSTAFAALTLFLEYLFLPQIAYGIFVQLLGLHKIPSPERFRQLSIWERVKIGWQLYLLKSLSFVALLCLVFAVYQYAKIIYTLAALRIHSVF